MAFAFGFVAVCLLFPRFVGLFPSVVALPSRPRRGRPFRCACRPPPRRSPVGPLGVAASRLRFPRRGRRGPLPGRLVSASLLARRPPWAAAWRAPAPIARGPPLPGPAGLRAVAFVPLGARSPRRPFGASSAAVRRAAAGRRVFRVGSSVPPRSRLAPRAPFGGCSSAAAPSGPLPRRGPSGVLCALPLPAPPVAPGPSSFRRVGACAAPSAALVLCCRLRRAPSRLLSVGPVGGGGAAAVLFPPPPFPLPLWGRG